MGLIEKTMPDSKRLWFEMAIVHSDSIHYKDQQLIDLATECETARTTVAKMEATVAAEVTGETEGGKPRYSNETSRKAEILSRLTDSVPYNAARRMQVEGELKLRCMHIDREEALRLFSIAKAGLGTCHE